MADTLEDIPPHNELMWPTLKAIKSLGGSATNNEILSKVIENEGFSEEAQSIPHTKGNRTKLDYRLAWAKTYLKKGGALENSIRGVWSITDRGERLTEDEIPEIVQLARLGRSPQERVENRARAKADQSEFPLASSSETDEENMEEEDWEALLISTLTKISPDAFERLSQRILRESGFTTVEVTGRSGDGGIDGTGILQLNLITFPVAFQCKRYQGSVGASAIRDFRGAIMGRCEKGLFITTGTFTSHAMDEARRDGALAIDLVDGSRLCDLLKSLSLGVKTEITERVIVEPEWFSNL